MRIACPACSAAYEVPQDRLPPGRVVHCARCAHDWTPVPRPPVQARQPLKPTEPSRAQPRREPAPPPPAIAPVPSPAPLALAEHRLASSPGVRHPFALRAAWALSGLALLAVLWLAFAARDRVMQAWPPSVRAYAALGLASRP